MRNRWKLLTLCVCVPALFWSWRLFADRQQLRTELIRFHVVANSNDVRDQAVKLRVRDAVLYSIRSDLENIADIDTARDYLQENLAKIREIANQTLRAAGFTEEAAVSLCLESFDTRIYDTFTLPAGVYESLRIVIGEGQGHNWWCVTFPNLCLPAASQTLADTAAGAGFSEALTNTITDRENYKIRFFLLDALGHLENILHTSK